MFQMHPTGAAKEETTKSPINEIRIYGNAKIGVPRDGVFSSRMRTNLLNYYTESCRVRRDCNFLTSKLSRSRMTEHVAGRVAKRMKDEASVWIGGFGEPSGYSISGQSPEE